MSCECPKCRAGRSHQCEMRKLRNSLKLREAREFALKAKVAKATHTTPSKVEIDPNG
jgi:hypothetical protein